MAAINNTFTDALRRYEMVKTGDHVTVALSGGADSVALLLLFLEVRDALGLTLAAAHMNHGIRGAEGNRDELFVRALCARLAVPLTVERADVPAVCRETGEGTEEAARRLRYAFLEVAAPDKIATAHTRSDNAETALFNLIRGSGGDGLRGIPPVRGRIIRPLLEVGGAELRAYLSERGQPFVEDSTNASIDYSRNRIRHRVLPELRAINAGVERHISDFCERMRADMDYLDRAAADALEAARGDGFLLAERMNALHPAILSRMMRRYAEENGLALDARQTKTLCDLVQQGSGRRELPAGFSAELLKGRLSLLSSAGQNPEKPTLFLKLCDKEKIHNLLLKNAVDYDRIGDNLQIRTRREGDAFTPAGRGCRKRLKKLLNEAAVPAAARDRLRILCDEDGILWVEGFGPDRRCAVTEATETVLLIEADDAYGGLSDA
ncbi:MAG: tRNA lysidine(34) synthetase TilS [Candidatus Howiella sp.]|jgi:tRNA(Ile)-lysidine synthase